MKILSGPLKRKKNDLPLLKEVLSKGSFAKPAPVLSAIVVVEVFE